MSDTGRTISLPNKSWGRVMALASVFVYLCITLFLSVGGCDTPEKRYRTLSFFFDGVPNPYAPKVAPGTEEGADARAGGTVTVQHVHKPYDEGHCYECHGDAKEFSEFKAMGPQVCLKCH